MTFEAVCTRLATTVAGFLLSAIVISASAHAAVVVGTLPGAAFSGGEEALFSQGTSGAFDEILQFTADAPIEFTVSAAVFGPPILSEITGFGMFLVQNTGTDFSTFDILATGTTNSAGDLELSFDGLFPGDLYGVRFIGTVNGPVGAYFGEFDVAESTASVSNVPIPAALPLFLTSVVGLILVARRHRRSA